jgi:hypothetical protein
MWETSRVETKAAWRAAWRAAMKDGGRVVQWVDLMAFWRVATSAV